MAETTKQKHEENDSDFESCDSNQSISIGQQVQEAIRELPSLQEKVQAIAINHYLIQKRQNDEKLQVDKAKIQFKTRTSYNGQIQQIYAIIEGTAALTKEDYQFISQQKDIFKQGELQTVQKIMSGQQKLQKQSQQIQNYWSKCLNNSDIINQQIHDNDRKVFQFLQRIQSWRNQDGSKLIVSFTFKPNKWFKNTKIQKKFEIKPAKSQLVKSYGDEIQWNQGMNYTVKIVKQKSKKGKKSQKTHQIRQPSFFHYFMPLSSLPEENKSQLDEQQWEDLMQDLQSQHQLAVHIHEDLIPKSLQYYLGKFEGQHGNCHCHGHTTDGKQAENKQDEENGEDEESSQQALKEL